MVSRKLSVSVSALLLACAAAISGSGCGSAGANVAVVAGATSLLGATIPGQELEQVYYLGVFDPQEQVPEAVYRITVHGQASIYSAMRFASGWVPAKFVDSLGTQIGSVQNPTNGPLTFDKGKDEFLANLKPGRRLMMFGPEGFRESPADNRLVIVMGSSPESFFKAIDLTLGAIGSGQVEQMPPDLANKIGSQMAAAKVEEDALNQIKNGVNSYEWVQPKL